MLWTVDLHRQWPAIMHDDLLGWGLPSSYAGTCKIVDIALTVDSCAYLLLGRAYVAQLLQCLQIERKRTVGKTLMCPWILPAADWNHLGIPMQHPQGSDRPAKRRRRGEDEGEARGPPAGAHGGLADGEGAAPPTEGRSATLYVNTPWLC
jgi:hypothetical protein